VVDQADPNGGQPPHASEEEGRARKPFLLRLPPDLLAELRAWANQDLRSLNAHLEFLLRDAVRKRRGSGPV
jgi:hypothetical protein